MASKQHTAVVIGIGDGSMTRQLASEGYGRVLTVRFPGEALPMVPGGVFDAGQHPVTSFVRDGWREHDKLIGLAETHFFDRHPIQIDESIRARFAIDCYMGLCERPADFGDDILDGMQGAFHVAHNAKWVLRGPLASEMPKTAAPIIVIGSGPSLSRHIPALKALQSKCVLIASGSALDGLLDEGITPHFTTPMERDEATMGFFRRASYPGVTFAGKAVVNPQITSRFNRHVFAPCTDVLYTWGQAPEETLRFHGLSTGTMAVSLATLWTTGPIYLAGHDLAYAAEASHWRGANSAPPDTTEVMIAGNAGPIRSCHFWNKLRVQIEARCLEHGGVINLNELDGIGAKIAHAKSGSLPQPSDLPDLVFPAWPDPGEDRIIAFRQKLHSLPGDAKAMLTKLSVRQPRPADLDLKTLCPSGNMPMFAYVLRSLLAQFSYESFTGRSIDLVSKATAQAISSVVSQLMPMFEEMACAADD